MTNSFGSYLLSSRLRAGFATQQAAVIQAQRALGKRARVLSKSMLSLYERDEVRTAKPEVLSLFAELYRIPYPEVVQRWVSWSYGVTLPDKKAGFIVKSSAQECQLGQAEKSDITIVTLAEFNHRQLALPQGSEVLVAGTVFRDDDMFFEVVLSNLRRSIRYRYLHPATEYPSYRAMLSRLDNAWRGPKPRFDGALTFFSTRPALDSPLTYVVYRYPKGKIEGFVALSVGYDPHYFQAADEKLSWQLNASFHWTVTVAQHLDLSTRLAELQIKVQREIVTPRH